jgi:S1-C subfamily serine protease
LAPRFSRGNNLEICAKKSEPALGHVKYSPLYKALVHILITGKLVNYSRKDYKRRTHIWKGIAMYRAFVLLFAIYATATYAQDAIPDVTLQNLKNASTFIIRHEGGQRTACGSGFLLKKEGTVGYVVTNAHVIAGNNPSVTVIFKSGNKDESVLQAEIVGQDDARDLAVLKVDSKTLPAPINTANAVKLRETLPVYILGFPFGEALSLKPGNPAVTISRGSVSSIRMDEFGDVALVQIDGDINPGNSGGPIVDSAGNLIGISVAKVTGTNIGLAIPLKQLEQLLLGRLESLTIDEIENKDGKLKLKIEAKLIDPLRKVKGISVLLIPQEKVKGEIKANEKGVFPPISSLAVEYKLKLEGDRAGAEVTLNGNVKDDVVYLVQPKVIAGDGALNYAQPTQRTMPFSQGAAPPPLAAGPAPEGGAAAAKDDWLGNDDTKKKQQAAAAGKAVDTNVSLKGEQRKVLDATVTAIKIPGASIKNSLCWSKDQKFVYVLEENGTLHKVTVPEFTEEKQFALSQPCSSLSRSSEGLLVLVSALQELWVIDESNLAVKRKIPVAGARDIGSSPSSPVAFAVSDDRLAVLDLRSGRAVKELSANKIQKDSGARIKKHPDGVVLHEFLFPTVTPDGRYFLCVSFECLHRFRINGFDLVYEEMGPRIGSNPQRIDVSSDSTYCCLPSGGGNSAVRDHPKIDKGYGTYVYKVANLQMPIVNLSSGAYPRVVGFDKAGGKLYAQDFEHQLMTFTPTGLKEKEYLLTKRGDEPRQFLIHSTGKKLLVLTKDNLLWVEFPTNSPGDQ